MLPNPYDVMFHTTGPHFVDSILERGLMPQRGGGFTTEYGEAELSKYYPSRPLFLGVEPWGAYRERTDDVVLRIDVEGLPLAADIPSVVEAVGLNYGLLLLDSHDWPEWLAPLSERTMRLLEPHARRVEHRTVTTYGTGPRKGEVISDEPTGGWDVRLDMEELARPGSPLAQAAIELTGTAAAYDTIAPERIAVA